MLPRLRLAMALAAITALASCAGMNLGSLEEILASGAGIPGVGSDVSGEIRSIDTRRQEIEVGSGWSGAQWVRYDGRTEVLYQQRRYDVRDLERGDYVQVVFDDHRDSRDNDRVARTIRIQQSVRDRQGGQTSDRGSSRIERLDGNVSRVDTRAGWFEMEDRYGDTVTVTLPYQANRGLTDRFNRLRRGDRVAVEGERLNAGRMEVHRFL